MNKQAGYIAQAHLILIATATGFWFVSKIPFVSSNEDIHSFYSAPINNAPDLSAEAMKGKNLFLSKCASCHSLFSDMTGPKLGNVLENEQWSDRKKIYQWIRNPAAFMEKSVYTRELRKRFGGVTMTGFPSITNEEIDLILNYISLSEAIPSVLP